MRLVICQPGLLQGIYLATFGGGEDKNSRSALHGHFGGAYVYVPIHSAFDTIRRQLSQGGVAENHQLLRLPRSANTPRGAAATGPDQQRTVEFAPHNRTIAFLD